MCVVLSYLTLTSLEVDLEGLPFRKHLVRWPGHLVHGEPVQDTVVRSSISRFSGVGVCSQVEVGLK